MMTKNNVGLRQPLLNFTDGCPFLGRRHDGVSAASHNVRGCDHDVGWARTLPDELLEPLRAVVHVDGPSIDGREYLVTDSRDGFGHRQDSGCVPRLLFLGSVDADPLGDELLLFFVQRRLSDLVLSDLLLVGALVRTESPMRFRRDILGQTLVSRHVE